MDTRFKFHRLKSRSGIRKKQSGYRLTILLILCDDFPNDSTFCLVNSISLQNFLIYCLTLIKFCNCIKVKTAK